MRPSAHAEAAALRWQESAGNLTDAVRSRPPRPRLAPVRPAGPRLSSTAEGAAIRLLDRELDDELASRRAA